MVAGIERLPGGTVVFRVPFRQVWVDIVKRVVTSDLREWDPGAKAWTIRPSLAETVLELTLQTNGYVREVGAAGSEPSDNFALLHRLPTAPPELIGSAFDVLAKLHHPDRGGDSNIMRQLNDAHVALKERVAS